MSALFMLIFFVAIIFFIIGLISPRASLFYIKAREKRTRKLSAKIYGIVVVAAFVCFIAVPTGDSTDSSEKSSATAVSKTESSSIKDTANESTSSGNEEVTTRAYSAVLKPGYYEIGTDIPAGTYSFEIASGNGNVIDIDSEVNLVMGTGSDSMYTKAYKNAELSDGSTLTLSGCSIKVSTKAGEMPLQTRDNSTAKAATLSPGKYTVGTDFQPGYYDITLALGSGNAICQDNGLNAIFSTDSTYGVREYKNVPFEEGYKLDIESVTVKLTPSK